MRQEQNCGTEPAFGKKYSKRSDVGLIWRKIGEDNANR